VWDLDILIKPTRDALGSVIGWRRWNGRPQADDERIDRIVAEKRTIGDGESVGARIRILVLSASRHLTSADGAIVEHAIEPGCAGRA
jgi:hypothetical protein